MRSSKVLEMINQGRIEELKDLLRDEIYQEVLKKKPGAKTRYAAMKKYFTYIKTAREVCQKPAMIEYEGKVYTSFCNSYSLALTTEPCGAIELFTDTDRYPNVGRLLKFEGIPRKLDISKVIAEAKSMGYKLSRKTVNGNDYLMHFDGAYFRIGLLDSTYSIINDGEVPTVYHEEGSSVLPITIENELGYGLLLPVKLTDEYFEDNPETVVIEAE